MIFDTHSHCYWPTLEPRIDEVIENMQKNNITKAVQIGCDEKSSQQAIDLAQRYPGIFFATVGCHPETAQDYMLDDQQEMVANLEKLILENRNFVVAVGECGFDFHYLDGSDGGKVNIDMGNLSKKAKQQVENQKAWWLIQWELAQKYNLPLVIHTRDARDATLEFMKEYGIDRCVMHCFSEDWLFARDLLDFSSEIYFSFSGIVTYKNAENIQEAVKNIPLDRIFVETDAPFLAPQPVRGKINEPAYVRYTLEKIAELRAVPIGDIEDILYKNSLQFYRISGS